MPVTLPFRPSIGNYRFNSILNGSEYKFRVRWNRLEQAYFFDVREITDEPIIFGVKVVLGVYLGRVSNHRLFRRGVLVARPQGDDRAEPAFDDCGSRVLVEYFTREEMFAEILSSLSGSSPQ